MSVCPICGKPALIDKQGRERKYCSPACARAGNNKIRREKKRAGQDFGLGKRRCHDCGKPTTDYRCPACLRAWRIKNGVNQDGGTDTDDCFSGGVIGEGAS